jgi:hypothetical protein
LSLSTLGLVRLGVMVHYFLGSACLSSRWHTRIRKSEPHFQCDSVPGFTPISAARERTPWRSGRSPASAPRAWPRPLSMLVATRAR